MMYRDIHNNEVRLADQNLDQPEPINIAGEQREEGLDKRVEHDDDPAGLTDANDADDDEDFEDEDEDDEFEEGLLGEDDED